MTSAETETRTIRCNKAAKASKQLKPWYNLCNYLFCEGVKNPRIHLYIIALSQNCYVFLQQDGLPQMLLICSMLRGHLLNTLRHFHLGQTNSQRCMQSWCSCMLPAPRLFCFFHSSQIGVLSSYDRLFGDYLTPNATASIAADVFLSDLPRCTLWRAEVPAGQGKLLHSQLNPSMDFIKSQDLRYNCLRVSWWIKLIDALKSEPKGYAC